MKEISSILEYDMKIAIWDNLCGFPISLFVMAHSLIGFYVRTMWLPLCQSSSLSLSL